MKSCLLILVNLKYCLKCRTNTENINPKVLGISNGKAMISKCAICGNKKSRSEWTIK